MDKTRGIGAVVGCIRSGELEKEFFNRWAEETGFAEFINLNDVLSGQVSFGYLGAELSFFQSGGIKDADNNIFR